MAFAITAIEWSAYALPAVRPVLPPIEYADTETVTNMAFTAWERGLREFRFDLAFTGTASNNVEMAFGADAVTRQSPQNAPARTFVERSVPVADTRSYAKRNRPPGVSST